MSDELQKAYEDCFTLNIMTSNIKDKRCLGIDSPMTNHLSCIECPYYSKEDGKRTISNEKFQTVGKLYLAESTFKGLQDKCRMALVHLLIDSHSEYDRTVATIKECFNEIMAILDSL